jgi:hypothetical protein
MTTPTSAADRRRSPHRGPAERAIVDDWRHYHSIAYASLKVDAPTVTSVRPWT